jgi:hypothetical protein
MATTKNVGTLIATSLLLTAPFAPACSQPLKDTCSYLPLEMATLPAHVFQVTAKWLLWSEIRERCVRVLHENHDQYARPPTVKRFAKHFDSGLSPATPCAKQPPKTA